MVRSFLSFQLSALPGHYAALQYTTAHRSMRWRRLGGPIGQVGAWVGPVLSKIKGGDGTPGGVISEYPGFGVISCVIAGWRLIGGVGRRRRVHGASDTRVSGACLGTGGTGGTVIRNK